LDLLSDQAQTLSIVHCPYYPEQILSLPEVRKEEPGTKAKLYDGTGRNL